MKQQLNIRVGLALFGVTMGFGASALGVTTDSTGVIVLNASQPGALVLSGNARAVVPQVRANSTHSRSITGSGQAVLDSPNVATAGGANFSGGAICTSAITSGAGATADPLVSLAAPPFDAAADLGSRSFSGGNATLQPGYYSGGIRISSGTVVLSPGVYVLDGQGLTVSSSNAHVLAEGVVLYFRGRSSLTLSGGASMRLTPPISGPYSGISLFMDRADTARVTVSGGSGIDVSGTLYLPAAHLTVSGNAQAVGEGPIVGSFVIADTIDISGSGQIIVGGQSATPTAGMLFD